MKYYPKHVGWEMTLSCNMQCRHCGSRAGQARENELTEAECLDIADQLIDMGSEHVTFIGGEILLVPFWHRVARRFVDNKVATNIITNAYNIGNKQIEQLKQSGISDLAISIDGMEVTHNHIRGKKDSFRKVIDAFERLRDEGFYVSAITTLTKENYTQLDEMFNLLKKHNVWLWQLQLASPMGNCSDQLDFLIPQSKIKDVIKFIKTKRKERSNPIVVAGDSIGYFSENCGNLRTADYNSDNDYYGCGAGLLVIGIDSIGNVRGCESLQSDEFIEGNLRENTVQEIWNKEGAFSYNRNFTPDMLTGKCSRCDKGHICAAGCRSISHFVSGSKYNNIFCVKDV